jgi:hypothetical protein
MITRKRTTISFSEKQCKALELFADNRGIEKPTIPGMLAILIANTPEFKAVSMFEEGEKPNV